MDVIENEDFQELTTIKIKGQTVRIIRTSELNPITEEKNSVIRVWAQHYPRSLFSFSNEFTNNQVVNEVLHQIQTAHDMKTEDAETNDDTIGVASRALLRRLFP